MPDFKHVGRLTTNIRKLIVAYKTIPNDPNYSLVVFIFFKQKTAYEISECDWSSDVCSSDLKQKTAYENSSHIQKSRMPSSASDRKSTRLNSSHIQKSRMPSSA